MDPTWIDSLPHGGAWTPVAVFLAAVFGPLAILSRESIAKRFGGLAFIPRVRARMRREALEEDRAREAAAITALEARIAALQRSAEDDRRWWEKQRDSIRADLRRVEAEGRAREERLQGELADALEYIRVATRWARGITMWAEEKGLELPPPPFEVYSAWRRARGVGRPSPFHPREPPAGE